MVEALQVELSISQLFWRFWPEDASVTLPLPVLPEFTDMRALCANIVQPERPAQQHAQRPSRAHLRRFNNVLSETRRIPEQTRAVFGDFKTDVLDEGRHAALRTAEQAFPRLENEVERILVSILLPV